MTALDDSPDVLTAEIMKDICQIVPSDRRRYSDQFTFMSRSEIANDDLFYSALLQRALADIDFCRSLESAFLTSPRDKDRRRAPSYRIARWLTTESSEFKTLQSQEDADVQMSPLHSAVFALWTRFAMDPDDLHADAASGSEPDDANEADWEVLRDQLANTLEAMKAADTDMAGRIHGMAADLLAACVTFQRNATLRDEARAEELRERLRVELQDLVTIQGGQELLERILRADDIASLSKLDQTTRPLAADLADHGMRVRELDAARTTEQAAKAGSDRAALRAAMDLCDALEDAERASREGIERHLDAVLAGLVPGEIVGLPLHAADLAATDREAAGADTAIPEPVDVPKAVVLDDGQPPEDAGGQMPAPGITPVQQALPDEEQPGRRDATTSSTEPAPALPEGEERDDLERLAAILEETPVQVVTDAQAATGQDGPEEKAAWNGRQSLDDLLTLYLDRGELALAWHLADLAEDRGYSVPVPAALVKALAAGPAITGPYDQSTQAMGELLATAMSALERAEADGHVAGCRANTIALAALMRPALMARDTNARELLANLSLTGPLSAYSGVVNSLKGLRHDLQPGMADLTDLAGVEMTRRVPGILAEMAEWLPGALAAQGIHAPSNIVLHNLFSPKGRLGALFEAAQSDRLQAVDAELDFLQLLVRDKYFAENLVAEEERALRRPRRDAIRGTALDWICRWLRNGAELVLRWRTAKHEDISVDDHRKEDIRRYVSGLRKELQRMAHAPDRGDAAPDPGLDAAVQRCLRSAVNDMLALLDGKAPASLPRRIDDALTRPLLRLPGGCQPLAFEGEQWADERAVQRQALWTALLSPERIAADDVSALRAHLRDRAILPARELLARLERGAAIPDQDLAARRQELDEACVTATNEARAVITSLRHELEPLQSIDLNTSQQIQIWLDRLSAIHVALSDRPETRPALPALDGQRVPGIPADFPQLQQLLAEARAVRDAVRGRIMCDQSTRLQGLLDGYVTGDRADLADQVRDVIRTLRDRDLLTVEDIILRLQDGQDIVQADEAQDDHFSLFYPRFVSDLNSAEVGVGHIRTAIAEGGRVGPLDYSALDESDCKRSAQLFETWRELGNSMRPNRSDLCKPLKQFMERLGFTSVRIERETVLSDQLRSLRMHCDNLTAQHWFLPPVFGSEARGSYPVFTAHRNIDDEPLARELAKMGRDAPCILLVFGTWTRVRRENFASAMRRAKQTVLLIDDAQLVYLTMYTGWMERLFACAMPFGYIQPYTTSPGNIPGEMFFGREEEIRKLESATTDGCLVYGGRQLGKSALLNHVRKRFHQPQTGRHAYYLKIDEFGGPVQPADQIWPEIRRALLADQIVPKTAEGPGDILQAITDWLGRSGERRILLLIDEADMFLASEVRSGFPNLNRLKDLMETSERRFKVVCAGLHNVQRMARAPNSPLVHLSNPICIGPMNTTAESSLQARRLVTEPMRAAGFDYASPDLVQALLTRVNYYPSLVQVFCKALLEGISNQARPRGKGPRWRLEKDNLFESSSAEDINSQIRERFQWTLNLDPRYELIAKVLALHRLDGAEGFNTTDGGAMAPDALAREVENFWPRGYEKLPDEDFQAFLDEMVDLGVLIQFGRRTYGLRGAQVAQMLGQRAQLEHEILKIADKEPRVDYDPSFYYRRVRPDQSDRRSPLSDSGLQKLFDTTRPGLRFLIAPTGLWGGDAAQAITELADGWTDRDGSLNAVLMRGTDDELRRHVERGVGRRVVVISAGSRGCAKWVGWLAEHDQVMREGTVIPVFVGGHDQIAQLLPSSDAGIPFALSRSRPWDTNMLRAWLAEIGLQVLDTVEHRIAILEASGGSPVLLMRMRPRLEALVSGRLGDNVVELIREISEDFAVLPAEIGLSDKLVPEFCEAIELIGQGGVRQDLVELLIDAGNPDADTDLMLMERLDLFHRPDPENPDRIAKSALGALVYRTCERPGGGRRP